MTGFLTTRHFWGRFGAEAARVAAEAGLTLEPIFVPDDPAERLGDEEVARIEIAYFSGDVFASGLARGFFAAAQGAPNLRWMHVFNAGVDNPVFMRIKEKARLTTSSGSTAEPIAQTLICGLLMLARHMPHYLEAQRRHAWEPLPAELIPEDLSRQVLTVFGLGAIGCEIARLGRALGLHVIGVRRSPLREGDPVDELVPPSRLADVLPRTDWLALASPLTPETRRVIDARALSALPRGARVLNISRGEVIDEQALIAALREGHIAGAYLDVFETEPLPADSPLWEMPNVIITPHNSSPSRGNEGRTAQYFLRNLAAWAKGEELVNEVR